MLDDGTSPSQPPSQGLFSWLRAHMPGARPQRSELAAKLEGLLEECGVKLREGEMTSREFRSFFCEAAASAGIFTRGDYGDLPRLMLRLDRWLNIERDFCGAERQGIYDDYRALSSVPLSAASSTDVERYTALSSKLRSYLTYHFPEVCTTPEELRESIADYLDKNYDLEPERREILVARLDQSARRYFSLETPNPGQSRIELPKEALDALNKKFIGRHLGSSYDEALRELFG